MSENDSTDRNAMTTPSRTTPPGLSTAVTADRARSAPPRRRKRSFLKAIIQMALIAGLLGFNAWWYWRDSQPVPTAQMIAALMSRQQYAEAERALRERLRRDPNDGDAHIDLAKVLGVRNDLRGSAGQLHLVPTWWPKKSEALYREGGIHMMTDRAKDAEAAWLAVIKDDPLHPVPPDIMHDTCYELLKLYATEDRWEDAYPVIWRAFDEAAPADKPQYLVWRLRSEIERIAPLESVPVLRRYIAADPEDWEALRALARAEQLLGQSDEAERHFKACLKGQPENPRVWRDYLTMLHERGDTAAFSALLARAPRTAETEGDLWKFRGMACEKEGDMTGAAENYRQAIERNPNVIEYHYRLAIADERLGRRAEAAEHRKRTQQLRDARGKLATAYNELLDAQARHTPGNPALGKVVRQLAGICDALGMVRAAEGFNRILDLL